MNISEFLSEQLSKQNTTRYRLAKDLSLSESQVGRIFSGNQEPGLTTFLRICKHLNVSKSDVSKFYSEFIKNS